MKITFHSFRESLTFDAVPKLAEEDNLRGTFMPGNFLAKPKVFTNLSRMTNFDMNPHILEAVFGAVS